MYFSTYSVEYDFVFVCTLVLIPLSTTSYFSIIHIQRIRSQGYLGTRSQSLNQINKSINYVGNHDFIRIYVSIVMGTNHLTTCFNKLQNCNWMTDILNTCIGIQIILHAYYYEYQGLLYVGYRMFFHDRARGEAECEIMKKTFYNVGYNMVWLLTYFQIFFQNRKFFIFRKTGFKFYLTPSLTSMI